MESSGDDLCPPWLKEIKVRNRQSEVLIGVAWNLVQLRVILSGVQDSPELLSFWRAWSVWTRLEGEREANFTRTLDAVL